MSTWFSARGGGSDDEEKDQNFWFGKKNVMLAFYNQGNGMKPDRIENNADNLFLSKYHIAIV